MGSLNGIKTRHVCFYKVAKVRPCELFASPQTAILARSGQVRSGVESSATACQTRADQTQTGQTYQNDSDKTMVVGTNLCSLIRFMQTYSCCRLMQTYSFCRLTQTYKTYAALFILLAPIVCQVKKVQMISTAYPPWLGRPQLIRGECNNTDLLQIITSKYREALIRTPGKTSNCADLGDLGPHLPYVYARFPGLPYPYTT